MPTVQLLFSPDCPNLPAARDQLRRAFEILGAVPTWTEIDVTSDAAPAHFRRYGSPTILIDGIDIAPGALASGSACRLYGGSPARGVPPLDVIVSALRGLARGPGA